MSRTRYEEKLTLQQEKFCYEYVKNGGNAFQAYLIAYPKASEATADARSYTLLKLDKVKDKIAEILKDARLEEIMSAEEVLIELSMIAKDSNNEKTNDRIKALELMAKHHGLLTERFHIDGVEQKNFQINLVGMDMDEPITIDQDVKEIGHDN